MTTYLSRKIKFISAFLMVSVVFLHSYNYTDLWLRPITYITEGFNVTAMFQYFISNGITRFATPMFYATSGFLFYYTYKSTRERYCYKLKSRFFSLVIPFIIWNILAGLFLYSLTFFDTTATLLTVDQYVGANGYGISQFYMWFLATPAFQTWYLQQLIIFTVLSPVLYWLIKYTKGIIIALFAVAWLVSFDVTFADGYFTLINAEAFFFYSIGAYIAINKHEDWLLKKPSKPVTIAIVLSWIGLNLISTFIAAMNINRFDANTADIITTIKVVIYKVSVIVGIFAVWYLFDYIVHRVENNKVVLLLVGNSFFVFLMHEPMLNIGYQLGLALGVGNTDLGHLALYIGLPVSIIALAIAVSMGIKKLCPPVHRVLTGNRSN